MGPILKQNLYSGKDMALAHGLSICWTQSPYSLYVSVMERAESWHIGKMNGVSI